MAKRFRFHLPDMWSHGPMNLQLIDMLKEHPEYFRDGVEIASVYGCIPPAIWNGGRNMNGFANEDIHQSALVHLLSQFSALRHGVLHLRVNVAHVSNNHKEEEYREYQVR